MIKDKRTDLRSRLKSTNDTAVGPENRPGLRLSNMCTLCTGEVRRHLTALVGDFGGSIFCSLFRELLREIKVTVRLILHPAFPPWSAMSPCA